MPRPDVRRIALLMLLLAACAPLVPATAPPQLQHTPGVFISLDERHIRAGRFEVAYPMGWRIVKRSVAAFPMALVLISPDDAISIEVAEAEDCPIATPAPQGRIQRGEVALPDGGYLCLTGVTPPEQSDLFEAAWALVIGSLP